MNTPVTRIVFYAPTANALGGGETWVNVMANAFARRGYAVQVIARQAPVIPRPFAWPSGAVPEFLLPAMSTDGIPADRIRNILQRPIRSLADHLLGGWRPPDHYIAGLDWQVRERLANILLAHNPEHTLVICVDLRTGSDMAALAKSDPRTLPRFIVQHHNNFGSLNAGQLAQFRQVAKFAQALVALTNVDAQAFRDRSNIPNVAWVNNPSPPVDDCAIQKSRTHTAVTMGRLTRQKQIDHSIRAWGELIKSGEQTDWQLHIYGSGELRPRLEDLTYHLHIESSVKFMGTTVDPTAVFRNVFLQLLPSKFEGWGLTIGEAGSVGTPTIAYDCSPGVRVQIEDGKSGLLVKSGDWHALAESIRRFITNENLRRVLGAGASDSASSFSLAHILDQWEDLFRHLPASSAQS